MKILRTERFSTTAEERAALAALIKVRHAGKHETIKSLFWAGLRQAVEAGEISAMQGPYHFVAKAVSDEERGPLVEQARRLIESGAEATAGALMKPLQVSYVVASAILADALTPRDNAA